jgi:hypothetical protein
MAKPKNKSRAKPKPKRQPALHGQLYRDDEMPESPSRGLYSEHDLPDWGWGSDVNVRGRDYFNLGTDD